MNKTHLVIGEGEVGVALAKVLNCQSRDVDAPSNLLEEYDYIHISFPYQVPDFVNTVRQYQAQYNAPHVVVHSTVKVGTCDPYGWTHSPVRGKHPDLEGGLRAFVKHYGGEHAEDVAKELEPFFPEWIAHDEAAITEAGKLWELTCYGMEIVMQRYILEYCRRTNLPFHEVYTDFADTYNTGWRRLGMNHYVKPILDDSSGRIGGHCVVQGAELLNRGYRNLLSEVIAAVQKELEGP